MSRQAPSGVGYGLTASAVTLLTAGLFARFYSRVASTPDEPFYYDTIYPYVAYSEVLITAGLLTLLLGILLVWITRKQKED